MGIEHPEQTFSFFFMTVGLESCFLCLGPHHTGTTLEPPVGWWLLSFSKVGTGSRNSSVITAEVCHCVLHDFGSQCLYPSNAEYDKTNLPALGF